jgi:excisionase family DNA binding protein
MNPQLKNSRQNVEKLGEVIARHKIPVASHHTIEHKPPQSSFFEKYWKVTDLADHLKVSPYTIYDWVHRRVIPFHKLRGSLLRFKPSEIEKWLSQEGGQNGNKQDP